MKITRKEIRQMILEQVQPPQGPFLVMVVDNPYGEVKETFITKVLPEEDWWHDYEGGGYTEDNVINILDMSKKRVEIDSGLPHQGEVIFFDGNVIEIRKQD